MPISTGNQISRLTRMDEWLYQKTIGTAEKPGFYTKGIKFADQGFTTAVYKGATGGFRHMGIGLKEVSGVGYMSAATKYYLRGARGGFAPRAAEAISEWDKYFIGMHPRLGPSAFATKGGAAARRGAAIAGRTTSVLGVAMRGIMPGFALYGASESPHGFGIGLAEEVAGLTLWGMGSSMGMQLGGWSGGAAVRGLGKIPGIKKVAMTAVGRTVGKAAARSAALLGGPIGWFIGGLAAFETAKWAVGMALHTLPTFAKQFKADMAMSGYGGDYTDSAGAATMRQRSLQVMGKSFVNARSALGQEAALLHV